MASQVDATRTARTFVAAVLVLAAGIALRGHVPGAPAAAPEPDVDNPVATIVNVVILVAAVAIVGLAVAVRARQRKPARAAPADRPDWLRADGSTPAWRVALILACVLAAWLTVALLLSRVGGGAEPNPAAPARVPSTTPDARPAAPAPSVLPDQPGESPLLNWFYAATVAFLLVVVVGSLVARRRRPAEVATAVGEAAMVSPPRPGEPESLARAAELALAEVEDARRDPRAAIIACFAAMERELSRVPGAAPQEFDTASEVLERAVAQHALGPDTATQLVELFDEARFSPHVMNEGHRDLASPVLQRVLAELRVGTC